MNTSGLFRVLICACLVMSATTLAAGQTILSIQQQAPGTWAPTGKLIYAAQEGLTLKNGAVFVPPSAFTTSTMGPQAWNPKSNAWISLPATIFGRLGAASVVLNDGRVLVTGGQSSLNTAEIFNPASRQWTMTAGNLVIGRYFHRATKLKDGRVLLTGGCAQSGCATATAIAEIYDPTSDTFTQAGAMSQVRTFHGATLLGSGKVLITGGYTNTGSGYSGVAEVFDPANGQFTPTSNMLFSRSEHTATLMKDGRVLVTGGSTDYGAILGTAEVYNPASRQWSQVGDMPYLRYEHSAILLGNGKVLVAGGTSIILDAWVVLQAAELFDPATGLFTPTTSMYRQRTQFGLTLIQGGRVMAVGGDYAVIGSHRVYPGDAEIYQP